MAAARSTWAWQRLGSSLVTLALVLTTTALLYWAQSVLIPVALAALLVFLLSPLVTFLQRRQVPKVASVLLVTAGTGVVVGVLAWIFAAQVAYLGEQLPVYQENVTKRITDIREKGRDSLLANVQSFVDSIVNAATRPERPIRTENGQPPQPVILVSRGPSILGPLLAALGPLVQPLVSAGLVIVLLIYTLIDRENVRDRLLRLVGQDHMTLTTKALDDAGHRISRYLQAQFVLNASFGVVIAGGLWLLGMPHALLWGFLAAVLRYIPFLGPWLAAILPVTMSLMTADGWMQPILTVLLFVAFELLSNLVVEPLVYGRSIGVSQPALIVAVAFWTWLWGAMGLVLAAPLTVCLVILGKYVPALAFFDVALGDDPPLSAHVKFYQRLLARDHDEASDVAREFLESHSLEQAYDQILIPSLCYARRDFEAGRLASDEAEYVWKTTGEVGEELAMLQSGAGPTEETSDQPPGPQPAVLACAARDAADETAVFLLQKLLESQRLQVNIANADWLASEIITQAEETSAAIVCIAALPPGGLAHARLLCKRFRKHLPEIKVVVGRWGLVADVENNRAEISASGAEHFATTLAETSSQILRLAQLLRPSSASSRQSVVGRHSVVTRGVTSRS